MKWITSPGYETLFGKPDVTYEQLLAAVPSTVVIELLAALNNELNSPEQEEERQQRMFLYFLSAFDYRQKVVFERAFQRLKQLDPQWKNCFLEGDTYYQCWQRKSKQIGQERRNFHQSISGITLSLRTCYM